MKQEPGKSGRVLVVDDEEGVREFLAESLDRDGHDVATAANGREALELLREEPFDLVFTDLKMPVLDGMGLVRALRVEQPDVEVIVLTAFGDVSTAVEAMKLGAFDYLEKPLSGPPAVRKLAADALARHRQLAAPERPQAHAKEPAMRSSSPAMRAVVDSISKVAKTNATVLLTGQSGTGKEVTARAIHELSPRADKPFVAINCAVLTANLLESELFGHEKGAFTGAHTQRRGRLELADGGTFFLDEVAELEQGLQAKLLRALEERRFERLGGSQSVTVDVRWVAATHRDLKEMVRARTFREDLYHRLAVFPIKLPALRERREDLPELAATLLSRMTDAKIVLSDPVLRHLERQPWPGNIRQLKNALERALILADGGPISVDHFDAEEEGEDGEAPVSLRGSSLEDLEKAAIERALSSVGGNRRAAATKLGIGLRTLYEKLKRYGLR